jgi:hypothetical protein
VAVDTRQGHGYDGPGLQNAATIARAVFSAAVRERLLLMLTFYIDDGGKDRTKRGRGGTEVLAVAGYVAPEDAWTELEKEWPEQFKAVPLHTTDLVAGVRAFKGISQPIRRGLLSTTVNIVNRWTLHGVGRTLPLKEYYDEQLPAGHIANIRPFAFGLYACMNAVALDWPARPRGEKIQLVIESGTEGLGAAIGFANWLISQTRWGRSTFQGVSTGSKALPGLQAADILANRSYASGKDFYRRGPSVLDKWTRKVASHRSVTCHGFSARNMAESIEQWNAYIAERGMTF